MRTHSTVEKIRVAIPMGRKAMAANTRTNARVRRNTAGMMNAVRNSATTVTQSREATTTAGKCAR